MPLYAYKGVGANGRAVRGVKDADSPKQLRQSLRKESVVVTQFDLAKSKGRGGGKGLSREVSFGDFGGVKAEEIAAFTRQLSTLLKAGIPLADGLGALFEQTENLKLKGPLEEIRASVNEGSTFGDALAKHPKLFSELYIAMVRAGETAGNLDIVLIRMAEFLEGSEKLKSKVWGAMLYPIIMMVVSGGILMFLMVAVVPKITSMFAQQDKSLPLNTEILIFAAAIAEHHWKLMLMVMGGGVYGFRRWKKSPAGRAKFDRVVLKMPRLGSLIRRVAVARFTRTLGTMLQAGVPMLRALDTSKAVLGNVMLVDVVNKAKLAVSEGSSLAVALKRSGEFPPTVTHMIAVGEASGALEEMLLQVADTYEQAVDSDLQKFTAVLEPLMIVFMGGAIGFVVFSILMPLMDMQSFAGM